MTKKLEKIAEFTLTQVSERAGGVLLVVLGVSMAAALCLIDPETRQPRVVLDPSVDAMISSGDESLPFLDRVEAQFGSSDSVLVALAAEDVFTVETLRAIQRITERVEALDAVHHVSSLSRAVNIRSEGGELIVEPFFEEVPTSPESLANLRTRALSDPIYAGNLVSRDGRVAAIAIHLLDVPEQELLDSGFNAEVAAIVDDEKGDAQVWLTGGSHIKSALAELMLYDFQVVIPLTWGVMAGIALFAFRSLRGMLIPVVTVQLALLWSLASVGVAYGRLNFITMAAPPVLVVVGLAYSIHVLSAYYDAVRLGSPEGPSSRHAAGCALRHVAKPVLFTGITTAVGFFALLASPLEPIRQFGVFCGFGVLLTVLVTLAFVPALLAVLPTPKRVRTLRGGDGLDRLLAAVGRFNSRNGRWVLVAAAALAVLSLAGVFRIEVSTDSISNFREGHEVRWHFDRVNEHLEGANAFSVVLESDAVDAFKEPVHLRTLEALQRWLERQPEVGGSTSLVDYVKTIYRGVREEGEAGLVLPESRELVSQLLVIGSNDELERFVDTDYQFARILVRTSAMDSGDVTSLVDRLEAHIAELGSPLEITVTGKSVLLSRTQDEIAYGQGVSLAFAFVFIYAVLVVLFRSFRFGLLALAPNALPVLAYFGLLGWWGVTLNGTTAIVACLVLGIAVDDTIHILTQFSTSAKRHANVVRGAEVALATVGRPISVTTLAVCLGFAALMASQVRGQAEMGWLSAVTLAVAWGVDVTLTPTLATRMRIVTVWDALRRELRGEPHESIPLVAGLSAGRARALLNRCRLEDFEKDHVLIREGETGATLYSVLAGTLVVTAEREGAVRVLRELGPGDVIGEVALVTGRRTATVKTTSAVRVIRLERHELQRWSRRHPRASEKIHENLSIVMAERLASLTRRVP